MLNVLTLIPYKVMFIIMYISFFIFLDVKPYIGYVASSVMLVFLGVLKSIVPLPIVDNLVVLFFLTLIIDIFYDLFYFNFRNQIKP